MSDPLKKNRIQLKPDEGLEICPKVSHNEYLSDTRIVEFVKLLARHAAESDYAHLSLHSGQGGSDHD